MGHRPKLESVIMDQKPKKWTKIDVKMLMTRVKDKYLDIMKMRINIMRVDPMIAETKRYHKAMRRI